MNESALSAATQVDVTVIITSYNQQAYLEQCLDSIAAQTRAPAQVIVIDDFSGDDSANLIEHWLMETSEKYLFLRHERNLGLNASLNEGLALAEGRYLLHMSADDWAEPDRLERQVEAFHRADESTAILVSDIREVTAGGRTIVDHDYKNRLAPVEGVADPHTRILRLLAENVIPAPGVLIRIDRIREIGGYDAKLAFEDYDLWLRLSVNYSIAYEPGIVANYRIVDSGLTRSSNRRVAMLVSEADILAKHAGQSHEKDDVIEARLVSIAGAILDLQEADAFRHVLELAIAVSSEPWLRRTRRTAGRHGGMLRVRRDQAKPFGLLELAPLKKQHPNNPR